MLVSVSMNDICDPISTSLREVPRVQSPFATVRFGCPELTIHPKALAEPMGLAFVVAGFPSPMLD
jgi:hypothetical protein